MPDRSLDEQLTKYLTDVHSIEVQALAQMKSAPDIAGDEGLAAVFREHLDETREQERLVERTLAARRAADRAGDQAVVDLAHTICPQERAMAERLAGNFDVAVEASLREKGADGIREELVSYLTDAHSIEAQALQLLETGPVIAGFDSLAELFREHLEE